MTFDKFETLSFDCYGTLIDWETGIKMALAPWADRHDLAVDDLIPLFGKLETRVQQETPQMLYPAVLGEVMRRMGAAHGTPVTDSEAANFGASVGSWPPFSDSVGALQTLKESFELAILSNVDRDSFARSNELLEVEFDLILTAEDIGSYKPDRRNFLALLEALGDNPRLLHVAQSLFHDHEPALELELETVWIDRPSAGATPTPVNEVKPTWRFPSMAAFLAAMRN